MLFHINSFRQSVYRIPLDDGSSTGTHSGTGGGAEGAVGGGGDRQSTALALQGVFRQLQVCMAPMLCMQVYVCILPIDAFVTLSMRIAPLTYSYIYIYMYSIAIYRRL